MVVPFLLFYVDKRAKCNFVKTILQLCKTVLMCVCLETPPRPLLICVCVCLECRNTHARYEYAGKRTISNGDPCLLPCIKLVLEGNNYNMSTNSGHSVLCIPSFSEVTPGYKRLFYLDSGSEFRSPGSCGKCYKAQNLGICFVF